MLMLSLFGHRTRKYFSDYGGKIQIITRGKDISQECANRIFEIINFRELDELELMRNDVSKEIHDVIMRLEETDRTVLLTIRGKNSKVRIF